MKKITGALLFLPLLPWLAAACSSEDPAEASDGTGGVPSTGGVVSQTGGASGGGLATGGTTLGTGGENFGGAPGDGGTPGTGGTPENRSAGCGESTDQATGTWVQSTVNVGNGTRPFSTYLPSGYDPERAYPVILLLHGCGSGTNNLPMEQHTGSDAILVRGTGSGADTCWSDDQDLPFIDAMVDAVKERFCTNTNRFFAVGYSSGSWTASLLSCIRADVFRGIGTVAGGENSKPGQCGGPVARMFFNDTKDMNNKVEWARPGRDRMISQNQCTNESDPVTPSPCVSYRGCAEGYPVIWCETTGHGHSRRDDVAAPAFWNLFKDLD